MSQFGHCGDDAYLIIEDTALLKKGGESVGVAHSVRVWTTGGRGARLPREVTTIERAAPIASR